MAPKTNLVGEAFATRKRDACQAEIAAAAGQSKKPGDGKPNYLDRMKQATAAATKKAPQKIPSAAAVLAATTEPRLLPPPAILAKRLGAPARVIAIDVETHNWSDSEKSVRRIGPFGWYTLKEECAMSYARIVEIAWAIGPADASAAAKVKSLLVQPNGFEISAKAAKFHKITNETAIGDGEPLATALVAFMADVLEEHSRGGRVVAHHLDFVSTCICTPPPPTATVSNVLAPWVIRSLVDIDNDRSSTLVSSCMNWNELGCTRCKKPGKTSRCKAFAR